jgi:hypothetical protein
LAHVVFPAPPTQSVPQPVRPRDRLLNALAAVCIVSGAALFLLARRTLASIAAGSLTLPGGSLMSHVQFTDSVVLRSRVGIWLVVVGAILAVAAAMCHQFRRSA